MARIPKDAKRVFQGVMFDIYEWQQELYDGSKTTFQALKRPDAAIVIALTSENKVIITHDEQPARPKEERFPGGKCEPGESPLQAAKRELLEETGYEAEHWREWKSYEALGLAEGTFHYFVANNAVKVADQTHDVGERIEVELKSVDETIEMIIQNELQAYSIGNYMMQQILQGKQQDMIDFLTNHNK